MPSGELFDFCACVDLASFKSLSLAAVASEVTVRVKVFFAAVASEVTVMVKWVFLLQLWPLRSLSW